MLQNCWRKSFLNTQNPGASISSFMDHCILFRLTIVLYILRFTAYRYSFCIFKRFSVRHMSYLNWKRLICMNLCVKGKLLKFGKLLYVVYWHRHFFLPRGRSTIYAIYGYSTFTFIETSTRKMFKQWKSTGTCGQDPMLLPFFVFFFKTIR